MRCALYRSDISLYVSPPRLRLFTFNNSSISEYVTKNRWISNKYALLVSTSRLLSRTYAYDDCGIETKVAFFAQSAWHSLWWRSSYLEYYDWFYAVLSCSDEMDFSWHKSVGVYSHGQTDLVTENTTAPGRYIKTWKIHKRLFYRSSHSASTSWLWMISIPHCCPSHVSLCWCTERNPVVVQTSGQISH